MLTHEAALALGVTPVTVRHMERRGELQAERTESGVRLFDRDAVMRLAEQRAAKKATR